MIKRLRGETAGDRKTTFVKKCFSLASDLAVLLIKNLSLDKSRTEMNGLAAEFKIANDRLEQGHFQLAFRGFEDILAFGASRGFAPVDAGAAHFGYALAALGLGNVDAALAGFEAASRSVPAHIEGGLRYADLLLATGRCRDAEEVYRRLLDLSPDSPETHYGLGECLLQQGNSEAAKAAFETAVKLAPHFPAAIVGKAFLSFFSRHRQGPTSDERPIVCVPITPFVRDWLGGQIYILNFARTLSLLPLKMRPRLFAMVLVADWDTSPSLKETVSRLQECSAVHGIFDLDGRTIFQSCVAKRAAQAWSLGDDRLFWETVTHRVSHTFPVLYPSAGLADLGRPIYWVPDLQHCFYPENFSLSEIRARSIHLTSLSHGGQPILFSSEDSKAHFSRFFPSGHNRQHVWHFFSSHALDDAPNIPKGELENLGLPTRFYYTPNQFWQHKDHATLFRAIKVLINRGHDFQFVCTGTDLATSQDAHVMAMKDLIEQLGIATHLKIIGVLPRSLQVNLLRRACAIVQPSLFEGWSTVIEDARMFGRPLIVSDIPVHVEQLGQTGVYFRAGDPEALADCIATLDSKLHPGPDASAERLAGQRTRDMVRSSAARFKSILKTEASR